MSNQNSQYSLRFTLTPAKQEKLIIGLLELLQSGVVINSYQATSSLPGKQHPGSWNKRYGLIPPGDFYTVAVQPLWMPNVKGVEGSFYPIAPFEIPTNCDTRSDTGIHFDANTPGSLGCIVLVTQRGWDAFRRDMRKTADIDRIGLEVVYK